MLVTVIVKIEDISGERVTSTRAVAGTKKQVDAEGACNLARRVVFDAWERWDLAHFDCEPFDLPEFPTYMGSDGREHAEY